MDVGFAGQLFLVSLTDLLATDEREPGTGSLFGRPRRFGACLFHDYSLRKDGPLRLSSRGPRSKRAGTIGGGDETKEGTVPAERFRESIRDRRGTIGCQIT